MDSLQEMIDFLNAHGHAKRLDELQREKDLNIAGIIHERQREINYVKRDYITDVTRLYADSVEEQS